MAGYSKRSLAEKLGLLSKKETRKSGALIHVPTGYKALLGHLPSYISLSNTLKPDLSFIQFFTSLKSELVDWFPRLSKSIKKDGFLWICWPKISSGVETGLNENIIREIGLLHGMVDVKVIAIDDVWSGLKFVYRLKDRR